MPKYVWQLWIFQKLRQVGDIYGSLYVINSVLGVSQGL